MLLLILGFIFLIIGIFLFYKANQIKLDKSKQQLKYDEEIKSSKQKIDLLKQKINQLNQEKNNLIIFQNQQKENINESLLKWKQEREEEINEYIKQKRELADQYVDKNQKLAQKAITEINQQLQEFKILSEQEKDQIQNEINQLKSSLSAGVEARLREQQKKEKLDFYKLYINEADLSDVNMLENLKASFHKPVVLSKLIWTQYFQKQMNELCDRVLGKKIICGIYKITNVLTEQCYIGQSVNVADRWKQHCKCGLGIEASSTNKLYKAMQKDKVWNFTFELLEECPRQLLNEKEKFWIQMYQSNKFGLNTVKGNS